MEGGQGSAEDGVSGGAGADGEGRPGFEVDDMSLAAEVFTAEKLYNTMPPIVHKTEWLGWDCYRVAAQQDLFGRWQPPTLIMGRRAYRYMQWLKRWRESWVLQMNPPRHDIRHRTKGL